MISATLPSTLPIDGGFQGLRLARLSRLVRFLDHLDDVAGVLAGRDGPTDRKSKPHFSEVVAKQPEAKSGLFSLPVKCH